MTLTLLEKTKLLYDDHIFINISDLDRQKAESASANYSNQTGKNYASINSLVSNAFVKYLRENLYTNNEQITINIPEIWEFVNGSSITINIQFNDDEFSENERSKKSVKKVRKLILIPSDNLDLEECTIPQEWVDIPNWAGDYYLPVQVNLEEKYLHFWGYISRQSLKQNAEYNHVFRNYYVNQNDLISDLDLLSSAMIICEEKGVVESLPELLPNSAQNLINQLSEVDRYSPRLKVNFAQWGALLNDQKYLTHLYEQRNKPVINLREWLENKLDKAIELGWLLAEQIFPKPDPLLAPMFIEKSVITNKKVKRSKLINLTVKSKIYSMVMSLEITAKTETQYEFFFRVDPYNTRFLPPNLNLILFLKSGEEIESIVGKLQTKSLRSKSFQGDQGDEFSIRLTLDDASVIEDFRI